jgi:hypothetical protein
LTNVVPPKSGSSEHQSRTILVAEFSNDPRKFQTGVHVDDPTFVQGVLCQLAGPSYELKAVQLGGIAPQPTTERQHEKPMLPGGLRSPNAIEIARHLRNRVFHEFGGGTMIIEQGMRPPTRLFPDLMAGQSHIRSNRFLPDRRPGPTKQVFSLHLPYCTPSSKD